MKKIGSGALASGILCGIWTYIAYKLSAIYPSLFSAWLGFVGITSFFVAGGKNSSLFRSIASNIVGVCIGCLIIFLSSLYPNSDLFSAIVTGFFTFVICYIVHIDLLRYSACTFMGGYSAFATGGDWKIMITSIVIGNIVGYLCVKFGDFIYNFTKREHSNSDEWTALKLFYD